MADPKVLNAHVRLFRRRLSRALTGIHTIIVNPFKVTVMDGDYDVTYQGLSYRFFKWYLVIAEVDTFHLRVPPERDVYDL